MESKDDAVLLEVPTSHVQRVVCFGAVGVSAGMRNWALATDVDVVFISHGGTYLGQQLSANSSTRVGRLRAQLACADDPRIALGFARAVVESKIRHQITLIGNFTRREHADDVRDAVAGMRNTILLIPEAGSTAEVMGVEGAAARYYFQAWQALTPGEFGFSGRTRRPPHDAINAALGYGYAMLLAECESALVAAGLDPSIGLMHEDLDRRPSLALDLMEEFRPMVVD